MASAWIEGNEKGKLETAQNLLSMRLSVARIRQATGLTQQQIDKLK